MSGVAQNGSIRWNGMTFNEGLDWCDQNGVVIRRSGILDGEAIGYMAIETDEELKKLYKTDIKQQLIDNWRDQMVAQVKGERNHPSIHLWSIENEFLYINCINLYGGLMDEFEREVGKVGLAVAKTDPTRLWMTDGGSAAKDNSYPVHGDHYVYTNDPSAYPALAYETFPEGGGRGRWLYDNKRPRYAAEDYFASGINPADYAWIAGEEAFLGKTAAHRGMALVQRMLTEGYRWNGNMAAAHFWLGDEGTKFGKYLSNEPRAAFVKEQDWTFGSGSANRTVCVMNDSRFDEPMDFKWSVAVGGKSVGGSSQTLALKPGDRKAFEISMTLPTSRAATSFCSRRWAIASRSAAGISRSEAISGCSGAGRPWALPMVASMRSSTCCQAGSRWSAAGSKGMECCWASAMAAVGSSGAGRSARAWCCASTIWAMNFM